jgi:hypothetical protein
MDKWEYMTLIEKIVDMLENLNDFGRQGWELVSSVEFESGGSKFVKHFLKRRLNPVLL